MRSLLNFLERYRNVIIFLILEIFAVSMIVMENNYHSSKVFNGVKSVAGSIQAGVSNINSYFSLRKTNRELSEEIVKLRNSLDLQNAGKDSLFFSVHDTVMFQTYQYVNARVISNSVARQKNYITLDKGSRHGIETGMGVIGNDGIVGIVVGTSGNYSVVMSFLHPDMRLSVRIRKNNYFGSLKWNGKNYREAVLNEIPHHVEIALGDTIETTGFSLIFPEAVTVGTIIGYNEITGDFYTIDVALSTDFKNLQYVNVVRNLRKDERIQLEKEVTE